MFKEWLENHLPESLITAFATLVGWLAHRAIRKVDEQEDRIARLERDSVTKQSIDDLRVQLDRSITSALARVESRTDEILLHLASQDRNR
jgi:hypothetical protein